MYGLGVCRINDQSQIFPVQFGNHNSGLRFNAWFIYFFPDATNQRAMQLCPRDAVQSAVQQAGYQRIPLRQPQASSTWHMARQVEEASLHGCGLGTEPLVDCRHRLRKPPSCSADRLPIQKMKSLLDASIFRNSQGSWDSMQFFHGANAQKWIRS